MKRPTPDQLRALLLYESDAGKLFWRERPASMFTVCKFPKRACAVWNGKYAGHLAFTALSHGYPFGRIFNHGYRAHHVAWAIFYGAWPVGQIDHKNGDPKDFRICNLRAATQTQNLANAQKRRDSSSRFKGVFWNNLNGKWRASIQHKSIRKDLGVFVNEEDAARAYDIAATEVFGQFARTNEALKLYEVDQ